MKRGLPEARHASLRRRRLVGPEEREKRLRISAMRYPYKPEPMRRVEETQADIRAVQPEHRSSLMEILPMASGQAALSSLVSTPQDVEHEM